MEAAQIRDDTIDSFFEELDSLFDEFKDDSFERRDDEKIMAQITGVFDKASEYYDEDLNRGALLLGALSLQLSQMACSHEHFAESLANHSSGSPYALPGNGHDHHRHDKTHESKETSKTKTRSAARLGFYSALFTYKPTRPKLTYRSLYKAKA